MNIKCKICGSSDVVVACDRIMSIDEGCVFLCLMCRTSFTDSDTTVHREHKLMKDRTGTNADSRISSYISGGEVCP